MFCSIPGANIKVLNKTVEALSKLSDEVHIECQETSMLFTAYNVMKTSYAKYTFDAGFFFHYECKKQNNETVSCKVSNRSLMMIFKRRMEKRIESCKISLNTGDDNIVFHLRYKSGITTIHTFHLLDWECSSWDCDVDPDSNKVICKSALLSNVLGNFKRKDIQLYVDATGDSIVLRNYGSEKGNIKSVHSQIKMQRGEFHSYDVHNNSSFMIPVRALRSVVSYADSLSLHLLIAFTKGGSPLIITVDHENCHGYCVISTLPLDGTQSECSLLTTSTTTVASEQRNLNSNAANATYMDVDITEEPSNCTENASTSKSKRYDSQINIPLQDTTNFDDSYVNGGKTKASGLNIYQRCFEPTFHQTQFFGEVLCENSDSDTESDT